eukprot:GHVN01000174.1.p1 GENE.GHVN01000174.1~~GHVN01000174.1.p1  ORF type:complete len:161 (+),score=20.58 GHVN01000174.1:99-581(+)
MPHSFGYNARTRDKFSKPFRQHGIPSLSTYMVNVKRGDFVDIKVDAAIQKGMAHKFYHGRSGRVFNVTKRAVGVEIKKAVGNRQILKRIHVRIEHIKKSRCQEDFLRRREERVILRAQAAKEGKKLVLKRSPEQPKKAYFVEAKQTEIQVLEPMAFEEKY